MTPGIWIFPKPKKKEDAHLYFVPEKATIEHFYIAPKLRGKGLGSKMLTQAERMARKRGSKNITVWLPIEKLEDTRGFYERRGYKVKRVKGRKFPRATKRL